MDTEQKKLSSIFSVKDGGTIHTVKFCINMYTYMFMLHTCVSCTLSVVVINVIPHFDYFLPLHCGTGHGRPLLCLSVPPERGVEVHPSASATDYQAGRSSEDQK